MSCACVLKPQIQINFNSAISSIKDGTPDIQDCTWTYEREALPSQLESHDIPLEMWITAWDMVYQQVDTELTMWKEQNRKVSKRRSNCCSCLFPHLDKEALQRMDEIWEKSNEIQMDWDTLIEALFEMFRSYNIFVSLAPAMTPKDCTFGIQFLVL